MSEDRDVARYARKRKFEYPDETGMIYHAPLNASDARLAENSSEVYDVDADADDNIADNDFYAAMAEEAIEKGDIQSAFIALGQSISEMRNINSIKRVGEIFYTVFVGIYRNTGYDGYDEDANKYVAGAIGMFLAYTVLGGDHNEIESYLEDMAGLFNDIDDFNAIYDSVVEKINNSDIDNIVKQFFNKGV